MVKPYYPLTDMYMVSDNEVNELLDGITGEQQEGQLNAEMQNGSYMSFKTGKVRGIHP